MTPQLKAALQKMAIEFQKDTLAEWDNPAGRNVDMIKLAYKFVDSLQPEIERLELAVRLNELETLESRSDCIEDGCGLDSTLLRDNFLERIRELESQLTQQNQKEGR